MCGGVYPPNFRYWGRGSLGPRLTPLIKDKGGGESLGPRLGGGVLTSCNLIPRFYLTSVEKLLAAKEFFPAAVRQNLGGGTWVRGVSNFLQLASALCLHKCMPAFFSPCSLQPVEKYQLTGQ